VLNKLFRKRVGAQSVEVAPSEWPLSLPLLPLGSREDYFTLGQAVEGVVIFGETGAGKSSASGKAIAEAYLRHGCGGLVLCVKTDEAKNWQALCEQAGRTSDLRLFSPTSGHTLNFLQFEAEQGGVGAGETENIVSLLNEASQIMTRSSNGSSDGSEEGNFWKNNEVRLTRNEVQLLQLAGLPVTVPSLYRVLSEAPQSPDEAASAPFRAKSFTFQCLIQADQRASGERDRHDLGVVADFWCREFPAMSQKTRSVIVASQIGMLDVLNRGLVRSLMCESTTLSPKDALDGRIIVVDLNLKQWGTVGSLCQTIWKLLFQRCIERRQVTTSTRPVFLWVDEFQSIISTSDSLFQTTCRSSRCATVYLTQGLPGIYAALGGGEQGKSEAAMLLGNLGLKVFHANSCDATNQFASTLIGRKKQWIANVSSSQQRHSSYDSLTGYPQGPQDSAGCSEVYEFEYPPHQFATLRCGGEENHRVVDAIVYRGKRIFRATEKNWRHISFLQS
jgi:hypothetical protein